MFECTYAQTSTEITIATTNMAKENAFLVHTSHEEALLTSSVPLNIPTSTNFDETGLARNIGSGSEGLSTFVKRQRISQDWYISIEMKEKKEKIEGKNPFLF